MKTRTIIAEITGIASPSKNDTRFGLVVKYPQMEKDSGVRRFSDNVMEKIAENCGFPDFDSFADLLKACLDKGELEFTQEYRVKGDSWKNEKTNESGTIEKDHWAITGIPVYIPSEEISEELKMANRELLKEKMKNKPRKRASKPENGEPPL